ncbi:unnamed protein product [Pleuronectes platessa]|uniref:Uncharacterized protein n=1 Tax=Pleuronectes platessa TaxID=8262 RepID=A0A9N7TU78_PLEPL|nr:unnamed protein product [Pleuronectes platessa]
MSTSRDTTNTRKQQKSLEEAKGKKGPLANVAPGEASGEEGAMNKAEILRHLCKPVLILILIIIIVVSITFVLSICIIVISILSIRSAGGMRHVFLHQSHGCYICTCVHACNCRVNMCVKQRRPSRPPGAEGRPNEPPLKFEAKRLNLVSVSIQSFSTESKGPSS